jgi:hypothetical protein
VIDVLKLLGEWFILSCLVAMLICMNIRRED